jgi:GcrA cell cycle regulator
VAGHYERTPEIRNVLRSQQLARYADPAEREKSRCHAVAAVKNRSLSPFWAEPGKLDELRRLVAEGHSYNEIGKRLGCSKNAALSQAHRLSLPARPSPIKRGGIRIGKPKVPRAQRAPRVRVLSPAGPETNPEPVKPRQVATGDVEGWKARGISNRNCKWPLGHPGEPDFKFCGERAVVDKPYCACHCAEAYIKPPSAAPSPA